MLDEHEFLGYKEFCKSQRSKYPYDEPEFPKARFAISRHDSSGIGVNTVVHDMITGDLLDITNYGAW